MDNGMVIVQMSKFLQIDFITNRKTNEPRFQLVPLIGINVAQETTRSQALPGNALVWRLLPAEFTN